MTREHFLSISIRVAVVPVAAVLTCVAAHAQSPSPWTTTFNTETRYFTFKSSNASPANSTLSGGNGTQVYVPFALQSAGRPSDDIGLEFLLRSAYVYSRQATSAATGTFSGTTDTTLSSAMTYYGLNGIQPFVSFNVNIPTGTSNASGNQQNAKTDSDIVRLPAFGEGWNLGPTIGANIPIDAMLMASVAVGYTNRGPFQREADAAGATNRLDPGDVTTFTGTLSWRGERLALKGSLAYSLESVTSLDRAAFYKSGNRIILTGAAGYAWDATLSSRVQVNFSHFDKNKVLLPGATDLAIETFNSNSNIINIAFDTIYSAGAFSIGPTAGYVHRDHNGYDPTTFQFLSAKTSWSAGVAGAYTVTPMSRIAFSAARIWVNEAASPDKIADGVLVPSSAIPAAITDAWQATISGTIRF